MGSVECGGVGVTVESADPSRVSVLVSPSIKSCSSYLHQKDENLDAHSSEASLWNNMPDHDLSFGVKDKSLALVDGSDVKQSRQKNGKVSRSNSSLSKRSKASKLEVSLNETRIVDMNSGQKEPGLSPSNVTDKVQTAKQKATLTGKRGDRRNGKISKSKCDSFPAKVGLLSFSSAAGGNSSLGVHCSNPEINDFTKLIDELPLKELLAGNYKCPSFDKDGGKKAANSNETVLHAVMEAFSILRLQKPAAIESMADTDFNDNRKQSCSLASSSSPGASRNDDDKGNTVALSSPNKVEDSCCEISAAPTNGLNLPLYRPEEVLDHLSLPPSKDLDLLFLDAVKPTQLSKNALDLRSSKPFHNRSGLTAFPWSHLSTAYSKYNPDAVKLTASRSMCQGRWVKIGNSNSTASIGEPSGFLSDLELLTFDKSLVPLGCQTSGPTDIENGPSSSVNVAVKQRISSSATCALASEIEAGDSPLTLAAAQTLYDMATVPSEQDLNVKMRWQNQPSQNSIIGASIFRLDEKPQKVQATPTSKAGPRTHVRYGDEAIMMKKPRALTSEDQGRGNPLNKGPVFWSTPRSSRSSPSKSYIPRTKHHVDCAVKRPLMVPAPKVLEERGPKVRKLVSTEWNWSMKKPD